MTAGDDRNHSFRVPNLAGGAVSLLTREARRAPLLALTLGLQAWQQSAGVRRMVLRRGNEVLQIAGHTPLGRFLPQPVIDDDAQEEATRIATAARDNAPVAPRSTPAATKATATSAAKKAAATATKGAPAAKKAAPAPPPAAVEAGAPGAVTEQVEEITEQL